MRLMIFSFFFFNDTATTEIYTLSLHDALPICAFDVATATVAGYQMVALAARVLAAGLERSEEHTSELQSRLHLVCRLLLEKKKRHIQDIPSIRINCLVPAVLCGRTCSREVSAA